jgi:hypothetical protein
MLVIASSMSASVGFGVFRSSAAAAMICPDWQYPHWGTSSAVHAFCTGCEEVGDSPSMVTIRSTDRARARHLVVEVHRAGAALRDTAAVLRAGEPGLLADHPQQRGVRLHVQIADRAIDVEFCHEVSSPALARQLTVAVLFRHDA